MSEKLTLIDGHSILFRAFYGMPISMTGPGGVHTNAVYGFLTILNKVIEEEKPDYLAVAFDLAAPTFRHEIYKEYKGTRSAAPEEFHEQVPLIKKILGAMEIPVISLEGFEADDILGTLACKGQSSGMQVSLISGDRDLLQISDDHIEIIIPKTRGGKTEYERYFPADVKEAYGVTPSQFIDVKALMGDTSDNVPGLPGVGPKTASKIIAEYGSIEKAYEHLTEIKPKKAMEGMRDNRELLKLSRTLVTIRKDAPVELDKTAFKLGNIYTPAAKELFSYLGFRSFLNKFDSAKPVRSALNYTIVTDLAEAEDVFSKAEKAGKAGIALTLEGDRLYAASLTEHENTYVFIPEGFLTEGYLYGKLETLIRSGGTFATCGAKELIRKVAIDDEGRLFDAVIAAYLLDPLKSNWDYDLISADVLKTPAPDKSELLGKKGIAALLKTEGGKDNLAKYTALRSFVPYAACDELKKRLDESGMLKLFDEIEMPLAYVLASMENEGILASRSELEKYGARLSGRIKELTASIYEAAGEEFNINSPKQLGVILFEKLHLTGGKKTKTGYSTAADVLEKLAPDNKIVGDILEYRTLTKLKSTYADGLAGYIEEDGRIRTTFNQTITATGRLSSTDPNLQNIPMREELGRLIRKCFYPREGYVFVDADYSQIELRILAHMSGDEKLIEAYKEAKDIHRTTASQVFHVPFDEVTDLQRRNAKAVNFGIVYGISSFGLSQGLSISREEAAGYIKRYFETYPGIKTFLDGLVASAKEQGYVASLYGRKRPIPELKASNFMQRSFGERVAMNSPIQGTAADIMKIAMIRVYRRLKEEQLKSKLILQIHDELLIEAPLDEAEYVKQLLHDEMKQAADLKVTLETDCHIGTDWYEAK